MRKDLKEKRSCKFFSQRHLESYHVAASLVPGLFVHKNATGIVQMDRVRSCSSKTAAENDIRLDVSLNKQSIKSFASTPVTDFRAGRARFDISAEFFQKIIFSTRMTLKRFFFFFLKTGFKIGLRIIHG